MLDMDSNYLYMVVYTSYMESVKQKYEYGEKAYAAASPVPAGEAVY